MRLTAFDGARNGARSFDSVEEGLVKKSYEVMDMLNIPNEEEIEGPYFSKANEFLFLTGISQREIYNTSIKRMMEECPANEIGHSIRVALIGTSISKILNFGQDARITNWILGLIHDEGKLKLKKYYPEEIVHLHPKGSEKYNQELKKYMRGHVSPENISREWEAILASAAEQHHRYQQNSYPKKLLLPATKESRLLSKILAPADFLDAISSRPSKTSEEYRSPQEIIDMTLSEYGNLIIKYNGRFFPKIDISGKELITELHKAKFIARERPSDISEEDFRMNPFVGLKIE